MFHGRETSVITPPRLDRYRSGRDDPFDDDYPEPPHRGRDLEYHIDGLSFSEKRTIWTRDVPDWEPRFDDAMMARIRRGDGATSVDAIASTTELATNILMERFGVSESQLPALLFVDGRLPPSHVVVSLDQREPMSALYTNVLVPLADEFRRFEPYWKAADQRRDILRRIDQVASVRSDVATGRQRVAAIEATIAEAANTSTASADVLTAAITEVTRLERLDAAFEAAMSLEVRWDIVPKHDPTGRELAAMRAQLDLLDRDHAALSQREDREDHREKIVALRQKAHKLRQSTAALCKDYRVRIKGELDRLGEDPLRRVPEQLLYNREQAQCNLSSNLRWLEGLEAEAAKLQEDAAAAESDLVREAKPLRELSYDQTFLDRRRPDSIAAVQSLMARGKIPSGRVETDDEAPTVSSSILEGPWAKAGVILAAVSLIFAAVQVYPILFPAAPAANAPAPIAPSPPPPAASGRFTVTIVDSGRPTRKQIFGALTPIETASVSPLGEVDNWEQLAKTIGCQRPDVVVAHLHAFRALKGESGSEDYLFVGLRAIVQRSKETRFVLYSSTFGISGAKPKGAAQTYIVTAPQDVLEKTVSAAAGRIATDAAARSDFATMMRHMAFVAWPLPNNLAEPNRQDLQNVVAWAGAARAATRAAAADLCR